VCRMMNETLFCLADPGNPERREEKERKHGKLSISVMNAMSA